MNNELFTVRPDLRQIYGRTVTKEMKFDEATDNAIDSAFGKVHQTLDNLVLTTEIERISEYNGVKSTEYSKLVQELPEGSILLWTETEGYTLAPVAVYKLNDLEEEINEIKKIYKDNTDINPQ
jgi:hypothetical protein